MRLGVAGASGLGIVLAGDAVVVGIEAVGVAVRVVLLEEVLSLGLSRKVRAVAVDEGESGRGGEDE